MAAPTNHDGHKDATDPLLNHLLNLWFRALGHDSQSIGMSDRSHSGSAQPGHTENRGNAPHEDQDEQVPVKTRPFHHLPLRFAHNQPDDQERQSNLNFKWSSNQTVMMLSSFFIVSLTWWSETPGRWGWRQAVPVHSRQPSSRWGNPSFLPWGW